MLNLLPTLEPRYVCPGETHSISRAVHLSRLAACYPKCSQCSHQHETGQLPAPQIGPTEAAGTADRQRSLFTLEGVRGVYLNELNRHKAGELAAAFASLLWDAVPLTGRSDSRDANSKRPSRRSGPVIVVGFDERPSSPDLVAGVAAALRRMSCQVVDVGQTSMPCFRFAVAHLQAAGGIMITGQGCEPSWTGLDFVGKQGRPVSAVGRRLSETPADELRAPDAAARVPNLDDLLERFESGTNRPLRHGGTQRVFQATVPYLAGLWKHFHALRPLRIAIGCPVRSIRQTFDGLFEKLPVTLHWFDIPQRRRDWLNEDDADVCRARNAVANHGADFGFLIDDDGANVSVLDERGQLVSPADLLCLVAGVAAREQSNGAVVIDNSSRTVLQPRLAARDVRCWLGGWTQSELWQAMRNESALCAGGSTGRVWIRDNVPTTDAILTLAAILQAHSRDDSSLSEMLALESRSSR